MFSADVSIFSGMYGLYRVLFIVYPVESCYRYDYIFIHMYSPFFFLIHLYIIPNDRHSVQLILDPRKASGAATRVPTTLLLVAFSVVTIHSPPRPFAKPACLTQSATAAQFPVLLIGVEFLFHRFDLDRSPASYVRARRIRGVIQIACE